MLNLVEDVAVLMYHLRSPGDGLGDRSLRLKMRQARPQRVRVIGLCPLKFDEVHMGHRRRLVDASVRIVVARRRGDRDFQESLAILVQLGLNDHREIPSRSEEPVQILLHDDEVGVSSLV